MDEYAAKIVSAVSEFICKFEDEDNIYIVKWISDAGEAPAAKRQRH
jgi:hypothetical protein